MRSLICGLCQLCLPLPHPQCLGIGGIRQAPRDFEVSWEDSGLWYTSMRRAPRATD